MVSLFSLVQIYFHCVVHKGHSYYPIYMWEVVVVVVSIHKLTRLWLNTDIWREYTQKLREQNRSVWSLQFFGTGFESGRFVTE